jgi:hypothetical protein
MDIPGLGSMTEDKEYGWYYSAPIPVSMLGGNLCLITVEGYEADARQEDFHRAIKNFLAASPAVLHEVGEPLFNYYKDCEEYWLAQGNSPIKSVQELWQHVRFGFEPLVSRRYEGDRKVYISIECSCGWEPEHGLQFVLRDGLRINKLGEYDGHLTNSDAFGDENLENVVYVRL